MLRNLPSNTYTASFIDEQKEITITVSNENADIITAVRVDNIDAECIKEAIVLRITGRSKTQPNSSMLALLGKKVTVTIQGTPIVTLERLKLNKLSTYVATGPIDQTNPTTFWQWSAELTTPHEEEP